MTDILQTKGFRILLTGICSILFLNFSFAGDPPRKELKDAKKWMSVRGLSFTENLGQLTDEAGHPMPNLLFKAQSDGLDLYVTDKGLSYVFLKPLEEEGEEDEALDHEPEQKRYQYEKLEINLSGATVDRENIITEEEKPWLLKYYVTPDKDGQRNVRQFGKITVKNVYPGIDWILYGVSKNGFKYDFVVHPGADAGQIRLQYVSLRPVKITPEGEIHVRTMLGDLKEDAPLTNDASGKKLANSYRMISSKRAGGLYYTLIGYAIDTKVLNKGIVIDPKITWATFYGGNGYDGTYFTETDHADNVYIAGYLSSTNFPTVSSGGYMVASGGGFLVKFSSMGVLLWSTYVPGQVRGMSCNSLNDVYICGSASSSQPLLNSGGYFQGTSLGGDVCITRFDNSGNIKWSTFYGGSGNDAPCGLVCDANDNLFLTGVTSSTNFPTQNAGTYYVNSLLTGFINAFVVKFDNSDNRLWGTYYHGLNPESITTDVNNNLFISGYTSGSMTVFNPGGGAFFQPISGINNDVGILKFDNPGNLLWATYFGGAGMEYYSSVKADRSGNVILAGTTTSSVMPVANSGGFHQGALNTSTTSVWDVYVVKFNASSVLTWGTFLGGSRDDLMESTDNLDTDTCGNFYVSYETASRNVPVYGSCDGGYQRNHLDTSAAGNRRDIVLTKFAANNSMVWSTYLGGNGYDFRSPIDISTSGRLYVSGEWVNNPGFEANYPITDPGGGAYVDTTANGSDDVYVVRFDSIYRQISTLPAQTIVYPGPKCATDTSFFPATSQGLFSGGTYSAAPGLSIDPFSGKVDPKSSVVGTYVVSYLPPPFSPGCYCAGQAATNPTATVVLLAGPSLSITSPTSVCAGATLTLTATGAMSYTWNGTVQSGTVAVTPSASAVYTVSGADAGGCVAQRTLQVTPHAVPVLSVAPTKTICPGATYVYTVSGALSYTWNNGPKTSTVSLGPWVTTTYTVTGTNSAGCAASKTLQLLVGSCPGIEEQGDLAGGIRIIPNPSSGEFQIESSSAYELHIVSSAGVLVRRVSLSATNQFRQTVSDLPPGVYLVYDAKRQLVVAPKIIVQ